MAYAVAADVEDRMGRTLDPQEAQIVEARLEDAELLILSRIPDLVERVTAGKPPARLVAMVEADAVIRILRNPEGIVGETDGNYSYQLNWATVSGRLSLMPEEWRMLGLRRSVFIVAPKLPSPCGDGWPEDPTPTSPYPPGQAIWWGA